MIDTSDDMKNCIDKKSGVSYELHRKENGSFVICDYDGSIILETDDYNAIERDYMIF